VRAAYPIDIESYTYNYHDFYSVDVYGEAGLPRNVYSIGHFCPESIDRFSPPRESYSSHAAAIKRLDATFLGVDWGSFRLHNPRNIEGFRLEPL